MNLQFLRRFAAGALIVGLVLAAGCVHRINIQQGNFLDQEDVDRVAVGMTRVQVRALLGTPMLADPFHTERWDYLYYMKRNRPQQLRQWHFIVYFDENDRVARVEKPSTPVVPVNDRDEEQAADG